MIDSIEKYIVEEAWPGFGNYIADHGFKIVLILLLSYFLRRFAMVFIKKFIHRAVKRDNFASDRDEQQREDTLVSTVRSVTRVAVIVITGLLLLEEVGINIAPLIAGAGIAGVALGFGSQSLVKDFIAGIFVLTENHYRVGDVVELNQTVSGVVERFSLRETVLRDLDGMVHHIPNGEVTIATNMTMDYANVNLDIGVGYDTDIDLLEKIVNEVGNELAADEDWKDSLIDPPQFLRVDNFADSAITVKITGKTVPMKQWAVTGELRRRLKKAFEKNNIEIPFPQRVMRTMPDVAPKSKNKNNH